MTSLWIGACHRINITFGRRASPFGFHSPICYRRNFVTAQGDSKAQHPPSHKQADSNTPSSSVPGSESCQDLFDIRNMWKSVSKSTKSSKTSMSKTSAASVDSVSDFWTKLSGGKAGQSSIVDTRDAVEDKSTSLVYEESVEVDDSRGIINEGINSSKREEQLPKDPTVQAVSASFSGVAKMIGSLMKNSSTDEKALTPQNCNMMAEENQTATFLNTAKSDGMENPMSYLMKLIKTGGKSNNGQNKTEQLAITDIVAQIQNRVEHVDHGDMDDPNSLKEIFGMFQQYKDLMKKVAMKYVGNIDFKKLTPTAIFYYLEREDEIKNPSWKRRQHRFFPGIDMKEVKYLNDACDIALLSYADSLEEIRTGLSNYKRTSYELVYAEIRSFPGQPANFVAVKVDKTEENLKTKNRNKTKELEVIIVVRGTKTAADAFTDLLCESEPYQGGKAHSFIVTSGIYIADKHRALLLELLDRSGASMINLTLIGHSLGAGAASIAGMEFNNEKGLFYSPKIKAKVIGFGCPALVSEELAKKSANYITTVVNDSDVVPRMSGISVANMLINVLEFDWREYAKKDIQITLNELERSQPLLFRVSGTRKTMQNLVESLLEKYGKDFIATDMKEQRLPVELFPPGKCLHFYDDGRGISANYVPNTFFNEIDVTRRMVDGKSMYSVSSSISMNKTMFISN